MQEKSVKQVILIRRDLKMRRGKEIAQGSHASMSFLCRRLQKNRKLALHELTPAERAWMEGSFAKVTLQVESEEQLLEIHRKAQAAGLESHLITDSGRTEFHGQPTHTAVAIGPDYSDKIDAITGELSLY